jgi:hypothetical protein
MQRDPIATPTLARLYLGQGHTERARAVIDDCLARDPWDGHALVLRDRLAARSEASVTIVHTGESLRLAWNGLEDPAGAQLVLVAITQSGAPIATWVTSTRCATAIGNWEIALPFARGSACACIGRVEAGAKATGGGTTRGFAVLTVARPLSWP